MTNNKTTQEIIDEQIKKLAPEVREALLSVDYSKKLAEITQRQKLLIDQAGKLEMETSFVMLGLEPISDYISNLQKNLDISIEKAQEIAIDVNENIFKKIRDHLEKMDENMLLTENDGGSAKDLNRDQILNEIENPSIINQGSRTISFVKNENPKATEVSIDEELAKADAMVKNAEESLKRASIMNKAGAEEILRKVTEARDKKKIELMNKGNNNEEKTELPSVWTPKEIETLPNQEVKDVTPNMLETKMTRPTIVPQQVVELKSETKLPEIKKKPFGGVDPYREPLL